MNRFSLFTLLVGTAFLGACQSSPEPNASAETFNAAGIRLWNDSAMAANGIELAEPSRVSFGSGLEVNGRVEVPPQSRASLTAPLGGFIRFIGPYDGEFVQKGQVLVRLDDPSYLDKQREFLEAQAGFGAAEQAYERAVSLQKKEATSAREFQSAQSAYLHARARRDAAQEAVRQLGFTPERILEQGIQKQLELRAPFSGYVKHVDGNLGRYVPAAHEIVTLEDPKHMHLELAVFQKDIANVRKGQTFEFTVGDAKKTYRGTVQEVGQAQTEEGFYRVHGHPEEIPSDGLRSGQFLRATLQNQPEQRWSLPEGALVYLGSQAHVLQKKGNDLIPVAVEVIGKAKGLVGFADLPPGTYVVKGAHLLLQPDEAE
jgi:cobalt-zinc-cadmium efflux system membrane fusion protein